MAYPREYTRIMDNVQKFRPPPRLGRLREQMPKLEFTGDVITASNGKVSERNASAYAITGVLEGIGMRAQPVDFMIGQVDSQLQRLLSWGGDAETADLFGNSPNMRSK